MIGIYKITSPTGKIYIGQSINIPFRWNQYKLLHKTVIGRKLYHSLKKHGWESHHKEIIEECDINQLDKREVYWGIYFDVLGKNGLNGKLGESNGIFNDESKQKISKALMGRKITWSGVGRPKGFKVSEESKQKSKKPKSEETKLRMRKPRSEEAKRNMSYPKSEIAKQNMKWTRPERTCPYCGKVGKGAVMDRFHFNKCLASRD